MWGFGSYCLLFTYVVLNSLVWKIHLEYGVPEQLERGEDGLTDPGDWKHLEAFCVHVRVGGDLPADSIADLVDVRLGYPYRYFSNDFAPDIPKAEGWHLLPLRQFELQQVSAAPVAFDWVLHQQHTVLMDSLHYGLCHERCVSYIPVQLLDLHQKRWRLKSPRVWPKKRVNQRSRQINFRFHRHFLRVHSDENARESQILG